MEKKELQEMDFVQRADDQNEAACEVAEDFEQIEDNLWEEYLQESETDSYISPEKELISKRFMKTMTVPLAMVFTNIFFIVILFLAWYIPEGFLYGCSIFEGAFVMMFVTASLCVAGYDENHVTMNSILVYFPVHAGRLRREMYAVVGKCMGLQAIITCIPMLLMAMDFQPRRFAITVLCNVLSMLVVALVSVESSMHYLKAEK